MYLPVGMEFDAAREQEVAQQLYHAVDYLQYNTSKYAEVFAAVELLGEWFMLQLANETNMLDPKTWICYEYFRDDILKRARRSRNPEYVITAFTEFNAVVTRYYNDKMTQLCPLFLHEPIVDYYNDPGSKGEKRKKNDEFSDWIMEDAKQHTMAEFRQSCKRPKCAAASSPGLLQVKNA